MLSRVAGRDATSVSCTAPSCGEASRLMRSGVTRRRSIRIRCMASMSFTHPYSGGMAPVYLSIPISKACISCPFVVVRCRPVRVFRQSRSVPLSRHAGSPASTKWRAAASAVRSRRSRSASSPRSMANCSSAASSACRRLKNSIAAPAG